MKSLNSHFFTQAARLNLSGNLSLQEGMNKK